MTPEPDKVLQLYVTVSAPLSGWSALGGCWWKLTL